MEVSDASLVSESLTGNREAFGQIVARYQTLICSLTYSGIGDLSQSEDIAQETFLTAWRQLAALREPQKLKSWLCGIARNLACDALKRRGREPSMTGETLDAINESPAPELQPADLTINREEAEILWRSLERIPETYREPLILFYREHQSIESVAANLELTEDAVKQRLSRGRKLLQDQVLAFVEGALARTNPGKVFTLGVLAALPSLTMPAKAASIGVAAAKGGAVAKAAGATGALSAVFSPLLAIFGNYASYRMSMDEAQSDEERVHIKALFRKSLVCTLVLSAVLAGPLYLALRGWNSFLVFWELWFSLTMVIYFLTIVGFIVGTLAGRRRHLAGVLAAEYGGRFPAAAYEYRSRASLFGWPLLHVRLGDRFDVMRGPVKAWIAVGSSHAVGLVFASGGLAVAPLSFGGIAIGIVPFGALSVGLFSLGAFSAGVWAYGAVALGWQTYCACGAAWSAGMGWLIFAHDFAVGNLAYAAQPNNDAARALIGSHLFFRVARIIQEHGWSMMLLWVVPVSLQARVVARARRRREQKIAGH